MRKVFTFILICLLTSTAPLFSARNVIYSPSVRTLQAVVNQNWLSPPVMQLRSGDVLNVSFDELSHDYQRFTYHIAHCEADWSISQDLFESDYLVGFNDNPIEDYQKSINTTVLYTHYSLCIPNDKCKLKISGNYLLTIYDENGERVAEVKFMVIEQLMTIGLEVTGNTDIDINKSHQQVAMSLNYGTSIRITNPEEQIYTVVTQNDDEDNARRNMKPDFVNNKGLQWKHCRDLIFEGGNEYHKFEILDVSHPTMGIDKISWDGNNFNAYPFMDIPRPNYLYDEDADGAFYIRNSDNIDNDFISDYVYVHYKLKSPEITNGRIIVDGHWTTDSDVGTYVMEYDDTDNTYNTTVMQKQGYYSYRYLLLHDDGAKAIPPTEGSYWQTENRYQAYVYYRGNGDRTWRLVGYRNAEFKP